MQVHQGKDHRHILNEEERTDRFRRERNSEDKNSSFRSGSQRSQRQQTMRGLTAAILVLLMLLSGAFGALADNPLTSDLRQVVAENFSADALAPLNTLNALMANASIPALVSTRPVLQTQSSSAAAGSNLLGFLDGLITASIGQLQSGSGILGFLSSLIAPMSNVPAAIPSQNAQFTIAVATAAAVIMAEAALPTAASDLPTPVSLTIPLPAAPTSLPAVTNAPISFFLPLQPPPATKKPKHDAVPSVLTVSPGPGSINVSPTANIDIVFSESVNPKAGAAPFIIKCGGSLQVYAYTGSGTADVSIMPNLTLPYGTVCTVTVVALQISDVDSDDNPDTMVADYVFSFTTEASTPTDVAPTVRSSTPSGGASGVLVTSGIIINFSEPVVAADAAFGLSCGGTQVFTSSGSGTNSITLSPSADLPYSTLCNVTVLAARIHDVDQVDPPDGMQANYSFSFTTGSSTPTDVAPTVTGTSPSNGATGVVVTTGIIINFSEPVVATDAAFSISCAVAVLGFSSSGSGTADITLIPSSALPYSTLCSVRVDHTLVSDMDGSPDNMLADFSFTFTTEAAPPPLDTAPTVTDTTPVDGATGVAVNSSIVLTFSESVDVTDASFAISCSGARAFTSSGSGTSSITLTPSSALPYFTDCTVTVDHTQVSDTDLVDPPDFMLNDFSLTFKTEAVPPPPPDAAPTVDNTYPSNGATGVSINLASITINFSEPVNVTPTAFSVSCAGFSSSGTGSASITLTLLSTLPYSTTCEVTVFANEVNDTDTTDPFDNMSADLTFSFTTEDNAPTVTSVSPSNGTTGVPVNGAVLWINFSEAVNVTDAAFGIDCGGLQGFTSSGSGTAGISLSLWVDLPTSTTCNVTVFAANVSDTDLLDPPDLMVNDYSFMFVTGP